MDDLFGKLLSDPERDDSRLTDDEREAGDEGRVEVERVVVGNSKL